VRLFTGATARSRAVDTGTTRSNHYQTVGGKSARIFARQY
jgi:hypothetical protein